MQVYLQGFAPADEVLLFWQKDPKPFGACHIPLVKTKGFPPTLDQLGGCGTRFAQTVLAELPNWSARLRLCQKRQESKAVD